MWGLIMHSGRSRSSAAQHGGNPKVKALASLSLAPVVFVFLATCRGPAIDDSDLLLEKRVEDTLAAMTIEEKIEQMHGASFFPEDGLYYTEENIRLGIPSFKMVDGPRGVRAGHATTFPVGIARGAAWDPELERRVGEAMGREVLAKGGNVLLAPTMNILRHPAWGRAQETYGEDVHHMTVISSAFIQGAQQYVIATAKHYALNSIEDTRLMVDVSVDERTLREIYLPHFREAVQEAGVGAVMTSYNKVNGRYCSENHHLVREILKDEWGFDGFVMSDWTWGTHSTVDAAKAGLDLEMPCPSYFDDSLTKAVEDGLLPSAVIDDAVRRILRKKFQFNLDNLPESSVDLVEGPQHLELAREVARRSMVLLKNERNALPLEPGSLGRVAVLGALADTVNLGDEGSSNCTPSHAVTVLAGIQARAGSSFVVDHLPSDTLDPRDVARVSTAGAAVVVVGLTEEQEGEKTPFSGGDRTSLDLPEEQEHLIQDVALLNGRTVVLVMGGSAITMSRWIDAVPAVLMIWYPGQEGGNAASDILFGFANPSGRLPITFPEDQDQLPPFDNEGDLVEYGYYHGYRYLDRYGYVPLFPFGFGLSYTSFRYEALRLDVDSIPEDGELTVSVDVTNTKTMAGEEVVQLYVSYPESEKDRPEKVLAGFGRILAEPGEKGTVEIRVRAASFACYDDKAGTFTVEPGFYTLYAGSSSLDLPLKKDFEVR